MISLNGVRLALLGAAFARIANNDQHRFTGDAGVDEIAASMGATASVYDFGIKGDKTRFLRIDFENGEAIEFAVGPQPELVNVDNRPDGPNDDPNGSPVAMAA